MKQEVINQECKRCKKVKNCRNGICAKCFREIQKINVWNSIRQKDRKKTREKLARWISIKWIDFWNLILEDHPEYCFICGYYIPISDRIDYAKRPFKNGDMVHETCWKKTMTIKDVHYRLNPESMLICYLQQSFQFEKIQVTPLCRWRVKNDEESIRNHIKFHNKNSDYSQRFWKELRNQLFLKPNGKPFPQPRE